MTTSITSEIRKIINMKARRLFVLFSLTILSLGSTLAQPNWVPGTPNVGTVGPTTIPVNYGINQRGTVYIFVLNYNNPNPQTPNTVRSQAINPTAPGIVFNAVLPVSAGQANTILQVVAGSLAVSTYHTIYIVAANASGVLQATSVRLNATTLPCPKIQLFTFFGNLGECVNLGAQGTYQVAPLGVLPTGVLKGTTWTVDWGDGSPVWTYTSTADNDLPPTQIHNFSTTTDCAYQGTWTVKNPCNEFLANTGIFVVHGRDIPADGDGLLQMEEIITHTPDIYYVCEGKQYNITLADISTWNCQNPNVPPPLNPADYDNDKPRTIQFIYGETPTGVVMNTITGNVLIAGTNVANAANGYEGPVITPINPPNPNTQTDVITIPATSVAGQRFYVYIKNWNKCNPYTGNPAVNYEYEDFIIEIIDAPPAPIVTSPKNYCVGSVPATISATPNIPGNTIKWYADAGLTTLLYTGTTYTHGKTTTGTYNYWVTETGGNTCEGPPAQITMNIYNVIANNTVAAAQSICYGATPANLTGTLPTGGNGSYAYLWERSTTSAVAGFSAAPGANTNRNYNVPGAHTVTTWYRRVVTSGSCTHTSTAIQITVYGQLNGGVIASNQSICYNTDPAAFTNTTSPSGGTGLTYQWQWSPAGMGTWLSIVGANGLTFNDATLLTANRDYRRGIISGGGCGTAYSNILTVTVYAPLTPGTIGNAQSICYNTAPAQLRQLTAPTGGPGGYTYRWQDSPDNVTFTSITGATGTTYNPPALTANTYYRLRVRSGSCADVYTPSILITVNPLPTPVVSGNTSACLGNTLVYSTPLVAGHTYSWAVSNGTISGSSTNNTVSIIWNIASGAGWVRVTETITATGCTYTTPNYNVTVFPAAPGAAGAIIGPANVCYAQTGVNYSIAAVLNATNYVWTVPAGVTLVSGQGTTAIVVDFAAGAASPRTISVYPENGCGAGGTSSINVNIYDQLTAGTIGTAQSICYNTTPAALTELTAPTGGPGGYTYQWQSSPDNSTWTSIGGATAFGYTPPALTASTYYRRQVTSGTCGTVSSASVLITVYGNLTPGTIGTAQSICYNATPAALTELTAPTGGPGGYTYQWQSSPDNSTWTSIGGATGVGYAPPALTNSTYYRRQVTSGTCGTVSSASVLITVYGNFTPGTIGTAQSVCYNATPAALTELTAPTGGPGGYAYQWQSSPDNSTWTSIGGATSVGYAPPALTTSTYYRRQVTSGTCGTVSSASVLITVSGNLTPGTIGTAQSICYNATPAALTELTAPTGGPGGYTYQWQSSPDNSTWTSIGGATAIGYAPPALTSSTYYRRQVTSGSCGTVNSTSILITVYGNLTPGTIGSNQSICYNTAPAAFTNIASPTGGTGLTYQWQKSPAGMGTWSDISGATGLAYTETALLTASTDYRRVTTSASGCGTVYSNTITITVKQLPQITAGQNPTVCSGNALNYQILLNNFTNPGDNVIFTWPAPTLSAGITGGSARPVASAANITDTFINTSGGIGTATYIVTPYKDGCTGPNVNVVINVGSEPVLDPGLNKFVCSNTPTGLLLKEAAGSVVPTHYNIISITVAGGLTPDGANAVIPNATAPAAYLSADKFTNLTGVDKTVTYRVQPVLAPDCFGDPVDVVVTIRPEPVIVPGQTKTICSGIATGKEIFLVPANTPAGTLFSWNAPALSDMSAQGTAGVNVAADPAGTLHINDVIVNYSPAPITAIYIVTPVSQFTCSGQPITIIITINPEPLPQTISGRDKLCVNDKNVVYNVNPVGGSTFTWSVDPAIGTKTFDFNTNAIIIDAAAVPGSGNITVFEINAYTCPGDVETFPVQVYTQAAPENITGSTSVCANSTHIYSVTNRAGSVYSWSVPGGAAIIGDPSTSSITVVFGNVGGTIVVRETNVAGCITDHNPLAVTVIPLPTATISNGGTICEGDSRNLTVDFTGTGPYTFTYALNGVPQAPVNTAADPYSLNVTLAGTYTIVNVTDANCTNIGSGSATVTYFPKPTGIISGTTEHCRGNNTTLTMIFTSLTPFTFTYTDGTTPVTVTNHPTNVYTVSVSPLVTTTYTLSSLTDGNSCLGAVSGSAVITVNIPPVLTLVGTNLTCYNDNTGAVALSVTGNNPYGYAWTGPDGYTANTEDISGLKAGLYSVTVTDTKGCISTGSVTLTQPAVLAATLASTNIFCFGSAEGTITISAPSGGSGTYEYTIDGGTTWGGSGSFTGLNPGTYNVKIRDAASPVCVITLDATRVLTGPAVLDADFVKTDVSCFGANNGSIIISNPSGGFGTYGYSINGGTTWQGSGNFPNLAPGTYEVRIRDAAHITCVVILDPAVVIAQPTVLSATVNSTNITCFGSSDGTITISGAAGGHGTYEYSINGGGSWQASGSYSSLTPGTYNVQIRDAAYTSCYIILNNALVITQPAVLKATITTTMITCNGASDGIINITGPSGGYGTYEYTINGGTSWQASGLFNGLAPGSYDVRIRDAANSSCEVVLNNGVDITEPAALDAMVIDTDITCFGANNGTITVTNPAGGYGTYEYSNNGGATWQSSNTFTGLAPNTYDVRIRDKVQTACTKILDPAVVISQPAVLNATVASTNVTCNGANDGTITISSPTGGYGTYSYSINGGASWQGSGNFINLSPGTYNIRIRDAVNTACVVALNPPVVITEPPVLSATVAKTNITCFGAADGTIIISGAAGGYGSYEYTINGGATWQASNSFTALTPGFYNVKIRDATNPACIITLNGSLNITQPAVLNATVARTNVTCNGSSNGTITITNPTGGYGTYEYSINGGGTWQATGSYTALAVGSYDVQIRDAANIACVIVLNPALAITQPAILAATVTSTDVNCFGANDGVITITGASGGYGTYEYTINGGTTWSGFGNFTNLAPSTYDVRIRDAANPLCIITLNAALVITQPAVLSATVSKTNISCYGGTDGTITITNPLGGYGTYEYSINGGGSWQASGSFTALGPGSYNVRIRDAAHTSCVVVLNPALQITQPTVINAAVTPTMVTCNGAGDGIINITSPTGGSGTYEYSVNGGTSWQASGSFTALAPGSYDVRIRDAANTACVIVLNSSLTITEPAVMSANVASANVTC
ncbi:MAG: hypothetical protein MUO72_12880, partial [Bacteroidales bacterium]|nr:hypothetical protein [Bacteroidales bacterium]